MTHTPKTSQSLSPLILVSLALLAAGGPLGTDMYLPAFLEIGRDLGASTSTVQLTLSAFMVGMAVGQLLFGAISDSIGRKKPLVIGAALFALSSAALALCPNIQIFIGLRLIEGLAGGICAVVSRSIVPDVAHGKAAASALSTLMAIQGLAPAIAPLLGGFLTPVIGWRGIFWVITAFNILSLIAAIVVVPETRRDEDRTPGALRTLFPSIARCFTRTAFVGYTMAFAIGFGVLFSYISASPVVLEEQLGLSKHLYSITFAVNSLAIAAMAAACTKLVNRFDIRTLLLIGLSTMTVASALLVVNGLVGPSLWATLPLLFICAGATGLTLGNATALGVEAVRDIGAGAGSGAMGALQFVVAGVVSPLVGLGSNPALSMATCMIACGAIALLGCLALTRPTPRKKARLA